MRQPGTLEGVFREVDPKRTGNRARVLTRIRIGKLRQGRTEAKHRFDVGSCHACERKKQFSGPIHRSRWAMAPPHEDMISGCGHILDPAHQRRKFHAMALAQRFIESGKVYNIIAELDGHTVRLTVDGNTIVEGREPDPLLGPGHEMAGIYMYRETLIDNLRIYTSEPD